jgi:Flp pilus assembly protein TadD
LLAGVAGLVLLVGAFAVFHPGAPTPTAVAPEPAPRVPPADPRLTFPTPYHNVRPEVRYVGSAACAGCHHSIATRYQHHPMGRSAASAAELCADLIGLLPSGQEPLSGVPVVASQLARLEHYDRAAHDPFAADGLEHRIVPRGAEVLHRETRHDRRGQVVASAEQPVYLAIGSGTRGRSYVMARGDALVQSSISWFSQKSRWDLSPGYERVNSHFERPMVVECLYCHTDAVEPVEGALNRYRPPLVRGHAIGCERCHGPGELHVASRKRGDKSDGLDTTIVNPANLEPMLRESVCEQCHLQGLEMVAKAGRKPFDYRPGLPYHLFWSTFVLPETLSDRHKSITTVEQMHASTCYRKSQGALGCISCHDPHELPTPEEKVAYYRGRCLQCHGDTAGKTAPGCTETSAARKAQSDSCTACHMPRLSSADVAHTANTDHRVPRRPDPPSAAAAPPALNPGKQPLVFFHRDLVPADDRSTGRDLGIALVRLARARHEVSFARQAIPLLQAALLDWPDDVPAREALADALGAAGNVNEAVALYEEVLARAPANEAYLERAAQVAEHLGQEDKAIAYYRRALTINPSRAALHAGLGRVLTTQHDWDAAAHELEAGLRLDPFDLDARKRLVHVYLKLGRRERARKELDRVLGFDPPDAAALRSWFEDALRAPPS